MCILKAYAKDNSFSKEEVFKNFIAWVNSRPKDIGTTTRLTITHSDNPGEGGKHYYLQKPLVSANGSLMRNICGALYPNVEENTMAVESTILQSMLTHYGSLPVVSCVAHTLLITNGLQNFPVKEAPTLNFLSELMKQKFLPVLKETKKKTITDWLGVVGGMTNVEKSIDDMLEYLKDFEQFNPYNQDYRGRSGYCLLSLKIAMWALYWSYQKTPPPFSVGDLPKEIFQQHGFNTIKWVVSIGADSDTYGAIAGILLAAFHQPIPKELTNNLKVLSDVEKYFSIKSIYDEEETKSKSKDEEKKN